MWTLLQLTTFSIFVMNQVASAQNDCGNTSFTESEGVVTSPNFPLQYSPNLNCTYSIDVGRNNSILLNFLDIDLESKGYGDDTCLRDWLTITCNETNVENLDGRERYCGRSLPSTSLRFSNCPVVELKFFADSFRSGEGFAIEYTVFESGHFAQNISNLDCGETVFTNLPGVIRLPINPTGQPASVNCTYTISTNYTYGISLNIMTFQRTQLLESFANCNRDNITVGCLSDGETELNPNTSSTYCRRPIDDIIIQANEILFSNCSMVKISIRSSDYNFRGSYDIPFTDGGYDEECGYTSFHGPTGIVTSPRFPESYPDRSNCVYSIDVDRTKTVSLDFLSFTIQGTSNPSAMDDCIYDWLTVICLSDGSVTANPYQNRTYCGKKKPMTIRFSNCDSLTLNFVSNDYVNYKGFQLQYTITTAGYTAPNTTDDPDEGCGNTSFTGPVGFITSPRFPLSSPHNLDCIYSMDAHPNKVIVLSFLSFNIEGEPYSFYINDEYVGCSYDWLMISCLSNGSDSEFNQTFCGERKTSFVLDYSECNSLSLNFVTDSSVASGGFQLRYTVTSADQFDCGETLFSGPNGVVTSPYFPVLYPHNMSCTYSIDVGRNNSVLLKFKLFELEEKNSAGYCKDWLMISCNETTKANPNNNKRYCGTIQWVSSLRIVDCPSLVLKFFSDSTISSEGFMVEYAVFDNSNSKDDNYGEICGNTSFSASYGVISSRPLPGNFPLSVSCLYTIDNGHVNSVILILDRLSFAYVNIRVFLRHTLVNIQDECNSNWLTISCLVNGTSVPHPIADRKLCGNIYSIAVRFPACHRVLLNYSSDYISNDTGFSIRYRMGDYDPECGNTFFTGPNGVITSPRFPLSYPHNLHCLYSITGGQRKTISLSFLFFSLERSSKTDLFSFDCDRDWLTVSCLSDQSDTKNILSTEKYCGYKTTLRFAFPSCDVVALNFRSDSSVTRGGFKLRYAFIDTESLCGIPVYGPPSGVINFSHNYTEYGDNFDCKYIIKATEPRFISITTSTISLSRSMGGKCPNDWLLVSCHNYSWTRIYHSSCRNHNYRHVYFWRNCTTASVEYFRESVSAMAAFRVEYAFTSHELPTTSVSPTASVTAETSCATGCKLSQDATYCECLPDTSQTPAISISTEIPVTQSVECEVGCEMSADGTTCNCSTVQSGDAVVNTQMNLNGQRGRTVGISLTVILVVAGAICLGAFLILRRHRKKNRSEMHSQASEEETHQLELEDDSLEAGHRNQDRDTSRYLPLRPMSISDHKESSSSYNSLTIDNEVQPSL